MVVVCCVFVLGAFHVAEIPFSQVAHFLVVTIDLVLSLDLLGCCGRICPRSDSAEHGFIGQKVCSVKDFSLGVAKSPVKM